MATLKYKTPEGEWKKVSIGGGGSTEEVYVGSDAPTDENVKVWIDPQGTPSQPSQPSDNGRIYFLPMGIVEAIHNGEGYVFTDAETKEYRDMISLFDTTMIMVRGYADRHVLNASLRQLVTSPPLYAELSDDGGLEIMLSDDSLLVSYMDHSNFYIGEENGQIIAHG